ncbi:MULTISPECIES: hypothetical protein [unclassified Ruegeria]|uniref:hypothetical protein n=1 Tax=unclassified Ruegeria TaxID=2625375 RepID=UPI001492043E|nr:MULTISPECIES: hypothetical protein [unclassified Ruegeria]NOD87415.1 hypothetical protein [Ruegeria sp. HKCCD4318]NOE12970.1 hypothetical protein [Ruegeria sp. HKCCD4318-2]NOG08863.1 hypothetical protein [Ruegeria sp. HKCCD4315]
MQLTQHTATRAAKSVVKSVGFIRQQLDSASRAEQDGIQGAFEQRIKATAKFKHDQDRAQRAIDDTRAAATRYQRAANVLRSGGVSVSDDPLHKRCADLHRMGGPTDQLADQLDAIAKTANDAADRAEDRLNGAEDELRVTDAMADYLAALAKHNFDKSNPAVRAKHRDYMAWKTVSRGRK